MAHMPSPFVDPPWNIALDVAMCLASIPQHAEIAGMYCNALVAAGKRKGVTFSTARERYVQFNYYPVSEFARMLVEATDRLYPALSKREALRKLGQGGPKAFAGSLLGKVVLGSAEGVHATVLAVAKTYEVNTRPSRCWVKETRPQSMIVSLENVYHFLDSHHVGVFEGTLRFAGVNGRVRIASHGRTAADLLLEW
ncbi:MAG TPA: DUF2378 family protein [Polyangiaceae bacterium]|nr:DUF2378 family protein [Polyangiaceae bacterium]